MARTALTVQQVTLTGVDPADGFVAAIVDGHMVPWEAGLRVQVANGDAAAHNITLQNPATVEGLDVADLVVSVPAGGSVELARIGPSFRRVDDGMLYIDYAAITSMTVRVSKG